MLLNQQFDKVQRGSFQLQEVLRRSPPRAVLANIKEKVTKLAYRIDIIEKISF